MTNKNVLVKESTKMKIDIEIACMKPRTQVGRLSLMIHKQK